MDVEIVSISSAEMHQPRLLDAMVGLILEEFSRGWDFEYSNRNRTSTLAHDVHRRSPGINSTAIECHFVDLLTASMRLIEC